MTASVLTSSILVISFLPTAEKTALHTEGRLHSLGHAAVFGLVAFVLGRAFPVRRVWAMLLLAVVLLGFGMEFGEHMVFGGDLEWADVVSDGVGAAIGLILASFSERRAGDRAGR